MATKYELLAEIEELKARIEDLKTRVALAESAVEESRPYQLLLRKLEEAQRTNEFLRQQINDLRHPIKQAPVKGRPVKISPEQKQEIIRQHLARRSMREIATDCGVSLGSVSRIIKEHTAE